MWRADFPRSTQELVTKALPKDNQLHANVPQLLALCAQQCQQRPGEHLAVVPAVELTMMPDVLQQELVQTLQGLVLHGALTVHHGRDNAPQPGLLHLDTLRLCLRS